MREVEKIDSISAQLLLREAYEMTYFIFDHEHAQYHPWNLVLDRPKENYSEYGPLYRMFRSYRLRNIQKRFGLNITEFLGLPREYVELILRICEQEDQVDSKTLQRVKQELDDHLGK